MNGVTDLINIEAGALAISLESSDAASLLKDVCAAFQRVHPGRRILVEIAAPLPTVMVDRQRLGQAVNTLLLCALKCSSPASALKVSVRRQAGRVEVTISTEGPVAADRELYETIQEISRDQVKGGFAGKSNEDIALAVCKGVLNSHGGKLWAECGESGQGMTVGFSLPAVAEADIRPVPPSGPAPERPHPVEGGKSRILSVVENSRMLSAIQRTLSHCGYVPIGTLNYADLERLIEDEKPHLVLLDLTAPGARDFEVIQRVTQDYGVPAIVLSGQGDGECIVRAFEKGADDYIVKPFSPSELVARIRASFRKRSDNRHALAREEFVVGDLSISYPERRVAVAGKKVHLTATEYQLLYELSTKAGRVLTQDELLRRIWGEEYMGDIQLLRAFVKTLRQKLGDNARRPTYIFTEHGVGYRMLKP
ncbi:MAG: winged helix-turn-helix domain-containing protein [Chloroflexota bacterium]|nr:winged helix-turn-helix domain-containing protein [Chloroflexota bacterium]